MIPRVTITFSPQAEKTLADVKAFPQAVVRAVIAALNDENGRTVAHVQRAYMSFPKHEPTTLEGLRAVSNRLRNSVSASKAQQSGSNTITSSIGSNVKYAAIHEFGGVIQRTVKPGSVRLRTTAAGELMRQSSGRLAVFAKKSHKRVEVVSFPGGKSYSITMPARAPIQRGIADRVEDYRSALSAAVLAAWTGGAK